MAEQTIQDVVKEAQSMGDASPIDATATTTNNSAGDGEALSESMTAILKPSKVLLSSSLNNSSTSEPEIGVTPSSTNKANEDTLTPAITDAEEPRDNASRPKILEEPLANGDTGEHSAAEDVIGQAALAEISGGSDTDISRPGSVDQAKERPGRHIRSNSVKKPASFKAVSVTKNFLAKSAVSTPSVRPGDKVSPAGQTNASAQPTAKPRLVAKSGSGLGTVPRSSLSKLNGAGSGPDASKVWNKNQPIPPPPPKQFTDEELKQQYGIHLATRLQADESGKEAKWADIDDDEDDWAPETVEWMDGTKSTVAATENQQLPDEPKPTVEKETSSETGKPVLASSSSVQRPNSTSGTKTILKPGIHTLASSSKTGLVLKGAVEKPTLVAKPSAPAPIKSPWAPLPPVDKVSPVQINPPAQPPPQTRFSQRDPHGFDALPLAPTAKEFAPDDFNRSWRDDRGNKELFNSHNGRYEPVNDMRRGSFRDNSFRQPSVLQRPSQQGGPAEPSAAFQTSRSSAAEGSSWGRRRNSSNVSGGSGRRMSFGRLPDIPPMPLDMQHRRESQSLTSSEIATPTETPRLGLQQNRTHFPEHGISPAEQHHSWTQKSSPNASYVQPASPYGSVGSSGAGDIAQGAAVPMEDAVERQKRLMREKLERAKLEKQRQQEEEAREEAAKKERLRLKLEAMGLGGEHKDKAKGSSSSLPLEKSPQKDKATPAPVQSPPKPPVPTSEGEVAQYGLIKVHQPHPARKLGNLVEIPFSETKLSPKPAKATQEVAPKPTSSPIKSASVGVQSKSSPLIEDHSHIVNQPPQLEQSKLQQSEAEVRASYKSLDHSSQAWKPSLPQQESYPAWSSSISNNQPTGNVWGPPQYKDRALGNGTFDANYNRGPTRPASHQTQQSHTSQPGPIAPPSAIKLSPAQTQAIPNHTPAFSHTQMFIPSADMRQQQSAALGEISQNTLNAATAPDPGPIAPPAKAANSTSKGEWGNFGNAIQRDDAMRAAKWREELEKSGAATYMPQIKETFRLTKPAEDGVSRRKVLKTNSVVHVAQGGNATEVKSNHPSEAASSRVDSAESLPKVEAPAATQLDSHSSQPAIHGDNLAPQQPVGATASLNVPHPQGGRSSRFFPRAPEASSSQASTTSQQSDSPPPPETYSHPVFDGDANHPVVNLPVPKARVKLPPVPPSPPAPVIMPVRPEPFIRIGSQPLVTQKDWQARFNGLFGRTTQPQQQQQPQSQNAHSAASPPAPLSLAVASASKAPLDVTTQRSSATVSLPITPTKRAFANFSIDDSDDVVSKVTAEEALLEDREFGSLPTINLPKKPHLAANDLSVPPPSSRPNSKFQRLVEAVSATPFPMTPVDGEVNIRLPGAKETITKTMPKPRARKTTLYNNSNNKKRNFNPREGNINSPSPRSRKPSSNYQVQAGPSQNATPRPSTSGTGWNNNNARTNPQQNNAWNKRAAPGVVH